MLAEKLYAAAREDGLIDARKVHEVLGVPEQDLSNGKMV